MPALIVDWYVRAEIRRHPDRLYVFGDNFARRGFGGQAKECRGEPNCVGIATKRAPSMASYAFLCDANYDEWVEKTMGAWMRIAQAMDAGVTVVWPAAGLGTDRAQLAQRAPKIWRELQARIATLEGPSR
jgi:hypothetical protein